MWASSIYCDYTVAKLCQIAVALCVIDCDCFLSDVKGSLVGCAGYNMPGVCESLRFPIGVTTKANKDLVVCSTGTHCVKVFANYSVPTLIIGCSVSHAFRPRNKGVSHLIILQISSG